MIKTVSDSFLHLLRHLEGQNANKLTVYHVRITCQHANICNKKEIQCKVEVAGKNIRFVSI